MGSRPELAKLLLIVGSIGQKREGSITGAGRAAGWPIGARGITGAVTILDSGALRCGLRAGERLIGLDPGAKLVGIALSDVGLTLASPYGSLRRGKLRANAAEIAAIARQERAGGLVVGWPLQMDGSVGRAAQAARDWTMAMSDATGLPALLWDERLSTAAVNRILLDTADLSRKKRAGAVDRMAAAWILQSALDAMAGGAGDSRDR